MEQLLPVIFTQVIATVAIIYSNKVDIAWIKEVQKRHDDRLTALERQQANCIN